MPPPIESLEPRRLFADQAYTPIWSPHLVESTASNDNRARAQPLAKSYDGVTRLTGRVAGGKDKDFYRFDAVYSGRVTVSLSQTGGGVAGVSIYDSAGREVAKQTTGKTTFDARANRSYVLRVARVEGTKPKYQFSLKQTGLDVPEARVDRISRGVNLSSWFWNQSPYTDDPFEVFYNYITDATRR